MWCSLDYMLLVAVAPTCNLVSEKRAAGLLDRANIGRTGYAQAMKTAVSFSDPIVEAADVLACQLGLSRSALYTQAVTEFLQRHRTDRVTKKVDAL